VHRCINTGRQMKLMVQRLSEEQILALTQPHSDDSRRPNCHVENLKSAEILHPTPIPDNIQCTFKNCALIFPSSEEMKEHKEIHYQAIKVRCEVCDKLFSTKNYLKDHLERHTQLRTFDCDVPGCKYSAKVLVDLLQHKKRVHSSILHSCLLCGKNFKQDYFYKLHVAKHNTDTPRVFKCLYMSCQKLFEDEMDIRKHTEEAHKNLAQFQCNECGKCFASKQILAGHVVMHWDWRPFKCDIPGCSFSAKWLQSLQRHKNNVHTLNLIPCSLCGEMFKNKYKYKRHLQKHETATPGVFKCHHIRCNETFSIPKDLKMHTKQHKM
jgi:KRAB domain-containing zinc finger protein